MRRTRHINLNLGEDVQPASVGDPKVKVVTQNTLMIRRLEKGNNAIQFVRTLVTDEGTFLGLAKNGAVYSTSLAWLKQNINREYVSLYRALALLGVIAKDVASKLEVIAEANDLLESRAEKAEMVFHYLLDFPEFKLTKEQRAQLNKYISAHKKRTKDQPKVMRMTNRMLYVNKDIVNKDVDVAKNIIESVNKTFNGDRF